MNIPTTLTDTVVPPCPRCRGRGWHYLEAGADCWPFEVDCVACADDDPDDDDCRAGDDIAEGCPDDASRFAAVAAHYHAA